MTTATRYSGFLTIKCRMDDFDDVHCTVSHGKNVIGRVKTRPPRSGVTDPKTRRRVADDSAVAFDQYAHAALSFVSDSDADEADMIESLADFTDSGYHVSRRKPARKAASNGAHRKYQLELVNKIRNGSAVGHLYGVGIVVDGRRAGYALAPQASREVAEAFIATKARSSAPNGRSRLKRTKLACARRARATRKGSSKAASRLAKYCPKRRSRKTK